VGDAVFVIDRTRGGEAELFVKMLQIKLRPDADGTRAERCEGAVDGFSHELFAYAATPHVGVIHHAANGRLIERHAGRHEPRVRNEAARRFASEQMQRLLVLAVTIEVRAFLLDREDELAQGEHIVELVDGQLGEGDEVPAQHAVTLIARRPFVREKRVPLFMALTATVHHVQVTLSDVDRAVYEKLDLRLARHPSESARYFLTRLLAYCLSYEEGIAFSKGGLSSTDEPPIAVHDATGIFLAWIDVGAPSAERLHKAAKAARRVALFTHVEPRLLQQEAATRAIHRVEAIEVWRFDPAFLDGLEPSVGRNAVLEVVRNDGKLYVTAGAVVKEGDVARVSLIA